MMRNVRRAFGRGSGGDRRVAIDVVLLDETLFILTCVNARLLKGFPRLACIAAASVVAS